MKAKCLALHAGHTLADAHGAKPARTQLFTVKIGGALKHAPWGWRLCGLSGAIGQLLESYLIENFNFTLGHALQTVLAESREYAADAF